MRKTAKLTLILLMGSGTGVFADEQSHRGAELFTVCEVCHGESGEGNEDFGSPKLAGQHDWYLVTQLTNFRDGLRGAQEDDENGQVMAPQAASLDDQDIEDVVAYIMTLDANPEITDE